MIEKLTSFWRVLSTEKPIDIPIIQRDYAQGRESQSALRSRFLDSLFKALAGESSVPLVLDFVFGSNINEKFQPIDGQQRLTTLWLLHWYVALKAEKLDDENVIKYLKNFRYETRVSSREFCEQLCKPDNFRNKADLQHYGIVNFITNQPWFYKGWSRDPTISGMLRVLGSSGKKN